MGFTAGEVDSVSAGRHYDLYLLTDVDIPFVQDGTRDGEHIRHDMHSRFVEELSSQGLPYELLSGSHEQRLGRAIGLIDQLLSQR
jgi:nicotinamide riboside kinase